MTSGQDDSAGDQLYRIVEDLFPICRSITGNGLRETLDYVRSEIGCDIVEVPTGTDVFDWTIPDEWNITEAYIRDVNGKKIVDFADSNLHVVSYSEPIDGRFALDELRTHLHSIPDIPEAIPYKTSYYNRTWGFCLPHNQLEQMTDDEYDVVIRSSLEPGSLSYAELLVPGASDEEILISAHSCHPSLANDNLSGIAAGIHLARYVKSRKNQYSYRFLFAPGTIGAIAWLASNEQRLGKVVGGLTLANLGDAGSFNYKRSRAGDSAIDQAVQYVLSSQPRPYGIRDFSPYGYDERQYGSPGIDLPVGCLTRSVYGTFPEYHTSNDNLDFVKPLHLSESLQTLIRIVDVLEGNRVYVNLSPMGEPRLGSRGLYSTTGGHGDIEDIRLAYLWILNQSDGTNSLLEISQKSGLPFEIIVEAARHLTEADLLGFAK